jgi:hypothetical protein
MLKKLLNTTANELIDSVGDAVDKVITNDDEKLRAKEQITEIVLDQLNDLYDTQSRVLSKEMEGNWLQRNWRPMVMLAFACILIAKWFGMTDDSIDSALELKLMEIIELGLGGYVVGRTAEKVVDSVTKNTDLSFLKRKDRRDKIR